VLAVHGSAQTRRWFRVRAWVRGRKDFAFTTLFFTIRCLGRRLQFVAALVAALLVILLLHLAFYPWASPP